MDVPVGDLDRGVTLERRVTGEHLEEHDADGVDVSACVRLTARDDLGGEVGDRAEQGAGARGRRLGHRPGKAEVADLDRALGCDQHVLGLDVTVHQPHPVGGGERIEHPLGDGQGLTEAEGTIARDLGAQRPAAHVLHRQVAEVAVGALVQHGDDPRVGQSGSGASLAPEARDDVGSLGEVGVHDLEGDVPLEPSIVRQIDGRHPAARNPAHDVVSPVDRAAKERVRHECTHRREGTWEPGQNRGTAPWRGVVVPGAGR